MRRLQAGVDKAHQSGSPGGGLSMKSVSSVDQEDPTVCERAVMLCDAAFSPVCGAQRRLPQSASGSCSQRRHLHRRIAAIPAHYLRSAAGCKRGAALAYLDRRTNRCVCGGWLTEGALLHVRRAPKPQLASRLDVLLHNTPAQAA